MSAFEPRARRRPPRRPRRARLGARIAAVAALVLTFGIILEIVHGLG